MSTLCLDSDVIGYLFDGHGVGDFADHIAYGSDMVASGFAPRYWHLPDVTDTPGTPWPARDLAARFAAFRVRNIIGIANRHNDASYTMSLYEGAMAELALYATDPPQRQLPLVLVTGETMSTMGDGPLADDEYLFACAPKSVIPESVTIATYQNGLDFTVYYSELNRGWLLKRLNSAITTSTEVSYSYSYLKQREVDASRVSSGSVKIVRA